MEKDVVLWRVPGRGPNGSEGSVVIKKGRRPEFQDGGSYLGSRVVAVRESEIDCKIFEGGFWRTVTCSRSLAPTAIAQDPIVVKASGSGIHSYVIERVYESRFAPGQDRDPLALGILE